MKRTRLWTSLLALAALPALAGRVEEDQKIDQMLGILAHPWAIHSVSSQTRLYLETMAQSKTGLPAYEQQVERAPESPASLYQQLSQPAIVATVTRPRSTPRPTPEIDPVPTPEPIVYPNQDPNQDPNNNNYNP